MPDEAEVSGVVVGEPGAVIAGWAKLGERGSRRVLRAPVSLRTDDGAEVELLAITEATIGPVVRRTAAWQELESDPLAALCIDDAPAPDTKVELVAAVVRGGDRIAAWGTITERAFATEGVQDGAFRTSAEARVAAVTPAFVAIGDDAVAELARLRARDAKAQAPAVERPAPVRAAPAHEPAPPRVKPPTGVHDRLAGHFVPWLVLAWIAGVGALAILVPGARPLALVLAGVGAGALLAVDILALPAYRVLPPGLQRGTHPSATAFLLLGGMTVFGALWSTAEASSASASARAGAPFLRIATLVCGALSVGAAGWCITSTRTRRRLTHLLVRATPHPRPLADGVWGATDGTVAFDDRLAPTIAEVPHAVTDGERIRGQGTRNSKGHWSHSATTPLRGAVPELEVVHAGLRTRVDTGGALWWSAIHYDRSSPDFQTTDRADVIPSGAQVRVVGRAKGGVLAKGGAESLLVFAVAADRDVAAALQILRRRDLLALGFAVAGCVAVVAGLGVAIVG